MPSGYGAADGTALRFVGTELAEVVSSRRGARAFYVSRDGRAEAVERELPVRYLGAIRQDGAAEEADRGEALAA
jgi:hypothetical protein